MADDKVKGLRVLLLTDKGWFEVVLSEEKKKTIWRLINKEQIKLQKP